LRLTGAGNPSVVLKGIYFCSVQQPVNSNEMNRIAIKDIN
jgi:hypothetical protein